jgi:hypothetical protein
MTISDPVLQLLQRFHDEGVEYVLVGGQAVRLNGFLRATEDVDVLVKATRGNGEKIKRAMDFLPAASDLVSDWFVANSNDEIENIRVADDLLVDLLFSANGQTYESVQPFIREIVVEDVLIRVLDIDGLLLTKTDYREKDLLDKQVLLRIKREGFGEAD